MSWTGASGVTSHAPPPPLPSHALASAAPFRELSWTRSWLGGGLPPASRRPWGRRWSGGWRGPPTSRRFGGPSGRNGWGWGPRLLVGGAAFILMVLMVWLGLSRWVDAHLYPQVLQLAESRLQAVATEKVGRALLSVLEGRGYQAVMRVATTQDGGVSYLTLDAMAAGRLEMEAAVRVQQALNNLRDVSVGIPLGELSGIRVLGTWGPRLTVRLLPVGNIVVGLESTFQEAGINQTLHRLSMTVAAKMRLVLPRAEQQVNWSFVQPLGETLVVGKVPEVYASLAGQGMVTTLPLGIAQPKK